MYTSLAYQLHSVLYQLGRLAEYGRDRKMRGVVDIQQKESGCVVKDTVIMVDLQSHAHCSTERQARQGGVVERMLPRANVSYLGYLERQQSSSPNPLRSMCNFA